MIELFTEQSPLLLYRKEDGADLVILSKSDNKNITTRPARVGDHRPGEFLIFLFLSSVWGRRDSRAKLLCKAKYENIQIHEDREREDRDICLI